MPERTGPLYVQQDWTEVEDLAERSKRAILRTMELVSSNAYQNVQREIRADKLVKSGNLITSVAEPIRVGPLAWAIRIGAPYWRPLNFGRKRFFMNPTKKYPGRKIMIKPKKGPLLSWIGPDGKRRYSKGHEVTHEGALSFIKDGVRYFSKGHWMPATKGYHFVERAADTTRDRAAYHAEIAMRETGLIK